MNQHPVRQRLRAYLEQLRLVLARPEALLHLAVLGAACGLFSGLVIIALRLGIDGLTRWLGLAGEEGFEQLDPIFRLLLATLGGLTVGLIFRSVAESSRQVGVVHVIERMTFHQGRLPALNALMQFVGATLALASGHSVGREGPAVHLGAASGSLLGQSLGLPNNSNRLLVGAGCAGAIAAAFNTPLAGVIFALEVILMESTLVGITPIIVASVTATSAARLVFGGEPVFTVPALQAGHISELPFVIALGMISGLAAVAFIELSKRLESVSRDTGVVLRFGAAGAFTGLVGLVLPQVMGVGYDTVNLALLGQIGAATLVAIAVAKLVATAVCVGFGLPGGLIGPSLVIGATIGGAAGVLGASLVPGYASSPGYYAILGMGATMAATLQAPLAALIAILELTHNPAIVLPGMLAIISASLMARTVFARDSIFRVMMRARGLDYQRTAMETALAGLGVTSVADRSFGRCPKRIGLGAARKLIGHRPRWILIDMSDASPLVMPAAELASQIELAEDEAADIDLLSVPGRRFESVTIGFGASLLEAHDLLQESGKDFVLVENGSYKAGGFFGVLNRQMLIDAYLPSRARSPR